MDDRPSHPSPIGERPLSRAARVALVFTAATTILLFYAVALTSMVLLAALVVVSATLLVGAARFGLAGFLAQYVRQNAALLGILGRSFWLRTGPTFRIMLQPADAPRLFAFLKDLAARMGVEPPHEVSVEMTGNAWVLLKGYRRGAGRTMLGVGYDLLAALTESEVEAVLAHELAHAKLVNRGLSRWMNKGLGRLASLSGQLSAHAEACRQARRPSSLAGVLSTAFDAQTRRAARQVATYSRQDEFEADYGAAEVTGAAALRSSLTRLETLDDDLARLPWSERLARVQLGESFSQWLVGEIGSPTQGRDVEIASHSIDPYSTHPRLRDRIAALPPDAGAPPRNRPAIELLAEPDRVAERLMTEIMRVLARQERRNTKDLARQTRRSLGSGRLRPAQWPGVVLVLLGVFVAIAGLPQMSVGIVLRATGLIGAGAWLYHLARHRDRTPLPVPAFGTLTNLRPAETQDELVAAEREIVTDVKRRTDSIQRKRARGKALVSECLAALAERDYLRAHVAARLGLEVDENGVAAALGYAVAASGLGNATQMTKMLTWVRARTGFRTPNLKWGAAWALSLVEAWEQTEGLLLLLVSDKRVRPHPTYLSLLGLAQYHRGKVQSAIGNVERAVEMEHANLHHVKLLVDMLLTAGQVRKAQAQLAPLSAAAASDAELMLSWIRLSLIRHDHEKALTWAARLRTADQDPKWPLILGNVFESARSYDQATAYYNEALAAAFYPEAYVCLARIAAKRGEKDAARKHLLSALNVVRPSAPKAKTTLQLFHPILSFLTSLEDRRLTCKAWIATFPANASPSSLSEVSLLVCAPDMATARRHLQTIVEAMQPDGPHVDVEQLAWKDAAKEQQPVRPVQSGVQCVVG
ncbi:MAG TPA: M48 family metalloprotease [Gemmatimonadales bacterium]|jgi:Zn-dependent protease with chaperone function/tetratricopeptide (TPR) repeat protein|nr:M48 family metalloprotease [Gemmatimonadales bacterium]